MDLLYKKFAILISTKNRKNDLVFTLGKIKYLLEREDLICKIFDDGSSDGTFEEITKKFPQVEIIRNTISKGYLYCRNKMLNETNCEFAISLDDDAHIVTSKPLERIESYFNQNPNCSVLALRIFWGFNEPESIETHLKPVRVKSFVGCAHVWRMSAWRQIPNYPEWFDFYGEEDFAAFQLFKKSMEVHFFPDVLVNHRVNLKLRQKNSDFRIRQRRSLSSGWYLYFLFYPLNIIPRRIAYSTWMQFKTKILKGDFKTVMTLFLCHFDLLRNSSKLIKNANRFSISEFQMFQILEDTKIYWEVEKIEF